jgi:DNA polymerase-3 subunit epsilon
MRLEDVDGLFLDAQTTGATPTAGRILELAWGRGIEGPVEDAVVRGPADEIIPSRILKLTGLEQADLTLAVTEEAVFARLHAVVEALPRPLAVVHFARFEAQFLDELWRRHTEARSHPFTMICTHAISRRIFPDLPSRSIRAIAGYYGLGVDAAKRAASHVNATRHIWCSLCKELAEKHSVTTVEGLTQWLKDGKPHKGANRVKPMRRFQVERDVRLALPDAPGVYRMLGPGGRILYVGKATSLKARVNTYFRPSQKHASDKLEMLTQIQKIEVTPCETALEAALLETDLIKLHAPPYNVALKTDGRRLSHLDYELRLAVVETSYRYGPFSGEDPFAALRVIELALALPAAAPELIPTLFFRDVEPSVATAGLALFTAAWPTSGVPTLRAMLAQGVREVRALAAGTDATPEEREETRDAAQDDAMLGDTVLVVTPAEVASRLGGLIHHAARLWLRARALTQLSSSTIVWRMPGERLQRYLVLESGAVIATGFAVDESDFPSAPVKAACKWTVQTYDRVRVLWSELARIRREGGVVSVITG